MLRLPYGWKRKIISITIQVGLVSILLWKIGILRWDTLLIVVAINVFWEATRTMVYVYNHPIVGPNFVEIRGFNNWMDKEGNSRSYTFVGKATTQDELTRIMFKWFKKHTNGYVQTYISGKPCTGDDLVNFFRSLE
jgi:hypothetical protein